MDQSLTQSPLGKNSTYINTYAPHLLFPIPRKIKRDEIHIEDGALPFKGLDIWNSFEISWLNLKGKPEVAIAEFRIPCESTFLIESKSFKLYLNSFNQSYFGNKEMVRETCEKDLTQATQALVQVQLFSLEENSHPIERLGGIYLDVIDVECTQYQPDISLLQADTEERVEEELYSHLLKSNCLVTGQPDWGSLYLHYQGPKMSREGLLRYIVSLRNHNEFHEQCVERIFCDIKRQCRPIISRFTPATPAGAASILTPIGPIFPGSCR